MTALVQTTSRAIRQRQLDRTDRRYISRHEHGSTRGWLVRPPNHPTKLFSYSIHGGVWAALAAAQVWRNDVLASRTRRRPGPRKRARPGYGYVARRLVKGVDSFVAWLLLDDDGGIAATSASVAANGVAGARRACESYLRRKRREHGLPTLTVLRD